MGAFIYLFIYSFIIFLFYFFRFPYLIAKCQKSSVVCLFSLFFVLVLCKLVVEKKERENIKIVTHK